MITSCPFPISLMNIEKKLKLWHRRVFGIQTMKTVALWYGIDNTSESQIGITDVFPKRICRGGHNNYQQKNKNSQYLVKINVLLNSPWLIHLIVAPFSPFGILRNLLIPLF